MAVFFIEAGEVQGEYSGATAAEALDAYAKDSGYKDYAYVAREFGEVDHCIELDTEALCAAVSEKAGAPVMQDSYGSGVALVGDKSFQSYRELADAYGLSCWDFRA